MHKVVRQSHDYAPMASPCVFHSAPENNNYDKRATSQVDSSVSGPQLARGAEVHLRLLILG
jgi:hypothetical protein